ncbi:uncharacterized protein TRIADDRAFT_54056 [Trichoplax adhaerens]|uniref:Aladin seven-bladed propeller domain-containing protein n=1 Tax=Trichoplax adhaerens TaxID=10228 RepID=B3RQZ6_TRIAD|nr:hypothetical protein TRIADDRAFT_54056 [Trichoplax adhaerens]EDV26253.1 hypothetical protein TRIADDRAFT_54056 [Trichoplax adhaerens]|eukprot:XP_002110249.1 hypothetical protein TRIADDRAFT_54056 [Trichoplax adhaerens]
MTCRPFKPFTTAAVIEIQSMENTNTSDPEQPSCFSAIQILPPTENQVTICEKNCLYLTEDADQLRCNSHVTQISSYKRIEVNNELEKFRIVSSSVRSAFVKQQSNYWQKISRAWKTCGISGIVQELSVIESSLDDNQKATWTFNLQKLTEKVLTCILNAQKRWFPASFMINKQLEASYLHPHGKRSSIVALAWHPHISKFAVGFKDNTVRIMSLTNDKYNLLKHGQQEGVTCLAWRPFAGSTLAVGGLHGIIIWYLNSTRDTTSRQGIRLLECKKHSPVVTMAWSPTGNYLASGCPLDNALMIWDVESETCTPLRRSGGISLLKWSPDGSKLFAASSESIFRVWETRWWSCEKWSRLKSSYGKLGSSGEVATNLTNLQRFEFGNGVKVGGNICNLSWENDGSRLAVTFSNNDDDEESNSEVIVTFLTTLKPNFRISLCGFIRGEANETPDLIEFHSSRINKTLLSVCWSSGYMSFIPFYLNELRQIRQTGTINSPMPNQPTMKNNITLYSNIQQQ